MKLTSDQPGRPTSRQPDDPRPQLGPALGVFRRGRALRAVEASLGIAGLLAAGAQGGGARPTGERADTSEPAELDLEQLRVAQPCDRPKGEQAAHREQRVSDHERGHRAGDGAAGQDQLGPQSRPQQRDGRPPRQAARVMEAEIERIATEACRDPLQRRVRRPERAERRPRVPEQDGSDRQAHPDPDPEQHGGQRRDVTHENPGGDRAVPPGETERAEADARRRRQLVRQRARRVSGAGAVDIARGERDDDERCGHGRARAGEIEPQRHRQLERAADCMRGGGLDAGQRDDERGRGREQPTAH